MRNSTHTQGPSELERARMRRVLNGLPEAKKGTETFSESIYSELRAMRSELSTLSDRIAGGSASEEILSRGQVAKLLGVCVESVTKLVRDSKLPCRRVGKEYRFLKSEVLSWLAARAPETEE
jgi:excisionase family DNA binding protein